MDNSILNVEQAVEFLGVSEKTLIKLLREEHIPARKIGREWRFSKEALIRWLSSGDSRNYINKAEIYQISVDESGKSEHLLDDICSHLSSLKSTNNIKLILKELDKDVNIPDDVNLRMSYKQQRDIEKLEFKVYWPQREEYKIDINQK
ncbi:helix-turn-helix domain-containing protein [Clostridium luticellarii]|uniref:Helix-turn-helix domain protein n=1 Tax=Clostridium luticellarii TaxID=1691940 RepID=A0A2T0B3A9_9CLOT|nr:helix-turn-helix domain-containing protein [Clostridium luticellarii]MCI1945715.1 helix-turn-helix domain-containing protein [Clostridium luticellarii]MCI1969074.1 helix-turn-helix domain-containing protein [Clostridium luticellarii]MCI1996086.1 helix-turn-helix domain-containing protein [Clostridium luticellarii]MCI2040427.1 helix-turn-helix domain-containing protein [Clostridium luticellarii]PRR78390.1 Helix-turn-helix domain protein [Clostridium luticellarii]